MKTVLATLALAVVLAPPQTFAPDADGFIRNWLVLAPIAIEGESGAIAIDQPTLDNEASVKPKAGETVVIGNTPFTWKALQTSDYLIDFLKEFPARGEYV